MHKKIVMVIVIMITSNFGNVIVYHCLVFLPNVIE